MTTTTQMKNITMPGIAHPATLLVLATPAVTRNRLIHSVLNEGLLGRKLPAEAPPRCPRPAGGTGDPSSSYGVTYEVQGTSGTVTYAWTPPSSGTVTSGCTSTSSTCSISVRGLEQDQRLTATVIVTDNGSPSTLSSTAIINAVCGDEFC